MTDPSSDRSCRMPDDPLGGVFFMLDDQGKITCVSDGCSAILGYLPNEMIGKPISSFFMAGAKASNREPGRPSVQEINPPTCFPVIGKDGSSHQARIISRMVFERQETAGVIGLIGKISTGNTAEKITLQANTRIHLLNSTVRHDINNQLTVLNGYLSLMEQDDGMVQSPEIVKILLDAAEKIHTMISFTTEYKDLGTHLPRWTNLYETFQSALSDFELAGIKIHQEPACKDLELFTDLTITRVFHHLIDNSLSHGKTVSEITLAWRQDAGNVIIVYEDNGIGISNTIRSTLFQPGKMKKTGYGLFLVQEILAIHGFTITETGTFEKGVRFEIVVPPKSFRIVGKKQQQP